MASRHDRYAFAAVSLLALGMLFEGFRLLVPGQTWPGFAPALSRTVSMSFILLWATTGIALLLRHQHRILASAAFTLSVLSPLFMVAHAAITRVGGSRLGLLYFPLAAALGFALKRTLDRGERLRLPTENPGGRPPEAARAYRLMPRPKGRPS